MGEELHEVMCAACEEVFEFDWAKIAENRRRAIEAGMGSAFYCLDCIEEVESENEDIDRSHGFVD